MKDDYTTNSHYLTFIFLFYNPFTPKSDQFQISPAASPETPLLPILTTSLMHFSLEGWENALFHLGVHFWCCPENLDIVRGFSTYSWNRYMKHEPKAGASYAAVEINLSTMSFFSNSKSNPNSVLSSWTHVFRFQQEMSARLTPSLNNRIVEMNTLALPGMEISAMRSFNDPETGQKLYARNVAWTPQAPAIGPHIFCFRALDKNGYVLSSHLIQLSHSNSPHLIISITTFDFEAFDHLDGENLEFKVVT